VISTIKRWGENNGLFLNEKKVWNLRSVAKTAKKTNIISGKELGDFLG
jgi:hypothetical protein